MAIAGPGNKIQRSPLRHGASFASGRIAFRCHVCSGQVRLVSGSPHELP